MTGWKRRLARFGIAIIVLLLAGATFQGVATALDRRRLERTGQMVDAGGHQLHLVCTGRGRPAVILDAAAMSMSAEWGWVQRDLERVTRVCSYDRSGLGYSEAGDPPYDPARAVDELHTALGNAQIPAPYVLAGHALGAAIAQLYAARYGSELAALVLIDPPSPDLLARLSRADLARLRAATRRLEAMPWLARFGVLRIYNPLASLAAGLPDPEHRRVRMFLVTPDHLARGAREFASIGRTLALLRAVRSLGTIPMTVITAGRDGPTPDPLPLDRDRQATRARLSLRGAQHVLPDATDRTVVSDRTQAAQVAAIIRTAVDAARP